jgi:hypothetical protein
MLNRKYAILVACNLLLCSFVSAGSVTYPDVGPLAPGVTFTNIFESSATDGVPLYGAPTVNTTPIGMHFDPRGFAAFGSNGASDITDGQLNFTMHGSTAGNPSVGINTLSIAEGGDFSLAGFGTVATQLLAGLVVHVTVTQVDGMSINPITFTQNASIAFNLLTNAGIVQPWSMSLSVPIAAELTALNIPYTIGATEVRVVLDDQLLSFSEYQTTSIIQKKDFNVYVVPDAVSGSTPGPDRVVPEPTTTMLLLCAGFAGLALMRRARS